MSIAIGAVSTPAHSDQGPAPSLNSSAALELTSLKTSRPSEHARRNVNDSIEQQPDNDDEVPVDAVFGNVHKSFALNRPYEHQCDEHGRISHVGQQVQRVKAHVDPDD